MPVFRYEAVDSNGKTVKDTIEAASNEEAIELIHSRGYYPTRVKKIKSRDKTKDGGPKKPKGKLDISLSIGGVKSKAINVFTRQLSTLQDAGIPIVQSINILKTQSKKGIFKKNPWRYGE